MVHALARGSALAISPVLAKRVASHFENAKTRIRSKHSEHLLKAQRGQELKGQFVSRFEAEAREVIRVLSHPASF